MEDAVLRFRINPRHVREALEKGCDLLVEIGKAGNVVVSVAAKKKV